MAQRGMSDHGQIIKCIIQTPSILRGYNFLKMKVFSTLLFILFQLSLVAQSVGVKLIAGATPNTSLDVNGGVSFREGTALSLSNGVNSNVTLADYSLFRITGPTAVFSITGFGNGTDGRVLTIINATSYTMTLTHQATSSSANQINTGGTSTTVTANGVATLVYNATLTKWVLIGGQGFPAGWSTTGNSGTTAGTNFIGTTDNQNLVVKTNNTTDLTISNTGWGGLITYANNRSSSTYPSTTGYYTLSLPSNVDTSFSIVGSIGADDYFALYGNVPTSTVSTNGEMHIMSADDGNEPIIFEQFNQAGSITTERFRIHSNGYIGVNTSTPNVNLDIDGGLSIRPSTTVSLTADNQAVTVGNRSFLVLSSNNATATNRTFTLSSGLQSGQVLVILLTTNAAELADSGNCSLASTYALGANDTISLIWNGSTWYETGRSNN